MLLLTTACSGGEKGDGATVAGKGDANAPQVTISPGDGDGKAKPEAGVVVTAAGGTLEQVTVTRKGKPVDGALSADKTNWKSRTLRPNSQYEVSAIARSPKGKTTTVGSKFTTLKAGSELKITDVTPAQGEKVGVGMPIQVTFNRTVGDRKAVEQALEVKSTKPATGAWYWVSGTQVIFRTKNKEYWQANQQVTFKARLSGVKSGKKTYGISDTTRKFTIGDSHIITASTKTHRLVVRKNGKKVKSWGISAGKGGRVVNGVDTFLTTSGVHLTMGKENPAVMTSEWMGVKPDDKANGGYKEVIPFAVRISMSGEYIHAMAGTTWAQGRQNVSHGCLNSPPASAQWFYGWSYRGDVVDITGSKRKLQWDNGWSFYQMPWSKWVKGSALDRTVTTG
ncbi:MULTISPECIES: L,D-transpeptidase [Thermomonosporaceae]|uniref:L,D-transpeptidase n=1 Tax=Thermomonosporaceae TaxID=2012 RepID=UPI00255ADC61|nr:MULTISPECIES: Ig-like domain-containing protein [Thermomonosporaceae]MDL4777814.1 Ig-like domain-containing protein [Actinomadura xylanilytica]